MCLKMLCLQGLCSTAASMSAHYTILNPTVNFVQGNQSNVSHHHNAAHACAHDRRQTINRWLAAPDPSSNHRAANKKRQPDTGNWFIQGDLFAEWKNGAYNLLWLHGCPGCGKTILSSNIIQDVMGHCDANPSFSIAYYYFDFQDRGKQQCQGLIRSLITQFSDQCKSAPEALERLYSKFEPSDRQPDMDELATTLKSILQEFQHAYIIVDALDECTERDALLKLVEDILDWNMSTLHILFTSRKEREIEDGLSLRVSHQVDIQESVVAQDIGIHVRERLRMDQKLKKWPANVKAEIEATLTEDAHGMFRWVACQLDELRKCAKLSELRNALNSLPKTLDDTYERILINIDELYRDDVQRVLQLLCFSIRPIQLDEIVEALAVIFEDSPKFDPDERYPDPRDILTRCSSLVSISGKKREEGELRLAHFSVKEYLVSRRIQNSKACMYAMVENEAHGVIAQTCLAYLLQFKTVECLDQDTMKNYPLADYAARYWMDHVHCQTDVFSDDLLALIVELLQFSDSRHYSPQFVTWVRFFDYDQHWRGTDFDRHPPGIPSPLYYAVATGKLPVVQAILSMQDDVNAQGGINGNALLRASCLGHEEIVRLLLDCGADVNAQTGHLGNALQGASFTGRKEIVELLLDCGADVNAQGGWFGNALQGASCGGHEEIVKLLLDRGADGNAQGGAYGNALQGASYGGYEDIVKLLLDLDHSADVNAQGGLYGNALQGASYGCHEQIVKLLLDRSADVNAQGGQYGNALQGASYGGREEIVELLLDRGADVNAQGGDYGNALQGASFRGHGEIVVLLLDRGADVNAQGGAFGNALQGASYEGYEEIVKLLLDRGADVNALGGVYGNALQGASYGGHEEIVELLLDHGADVNAQGGDYGNAFQGASYGGHEEIVKLLLDRGADINAQGGRYGNALQGASYGGYEEIVKLLLGRGACINTQGGEYGNALQGASFGGHEEIVKLLLDCGADVNAEGGDYGNGLGRARVGGHREIVKLLLEYGAKELDM